MNKLKRLSQSTRDTKDREKSERDASKDGSEGSKDGDQPKKRSSQRIDGDQPKKRSSQMSAAVGDTIASGEAAPAPKSRKSMPSSSSS